MTERPKIPDEVEINKKHLFDPFTGIEISINRVTAEILDLCDGSRTKEEIAQEIASRYDIEVAEALSDVEEIIETLKKMGILNSKDRFMRKVAMRFNSAYKKLLRMILGG